MAELLPIATRSPLLFAWKISVSGPLPEGIPFFHKEYHYPGSKHRFNKVINLCADSLRDNLYAYCGEEDFIRLHQGHWLVLEISQSLGTRIFATYDHCQFMSKFYFLEIDTRSPMERLK